MEKAAEGIFFTFQGLVHTKNLWKLLPKREFSSPKILQTVKNLTFDHLVPKSRRGKTVWKNVVSACTYCNLKKGNRLLIETDMNLLKLPKCPSATDLQKNGKNFPPNYLHKSWRDYLYWDTELES